MSFNYFEGNHCGRLTSVQDFSNTGCPRVKPSPCVKPSLQVKPKKKYFITSRSRQAFVHQHRLSSCQVFTLRQAFALHQVRKISASSFSASQLILYSTCSYQAFRYLESHLCFKSSQVKSNVIATSSLYFTSRLVFVSSDVFSAIVSIDINNQLILSCVPIMIRTSLIQIPIFFYL